jgi:hypothetical protein
MVGLSFLLNKRTACVRPFAGTATTKMDLQEALALVEERWLAHTSAPKD